MSARPFGRPPLVRSVAIGVGATAIMDVSSEVRRRATGVAPLDYRLVGRWIGHLRHRRLYHQDIAAARPIVHEREIGWAAHYTIGTAFAAALVLARPNWHAEPTFAPALATGLLSTAAPWLLMQPAFGMGVAASRTADPTTARLRSLCTHATYGIGLYLAAATAARLRRL
ncbi:MAG: DUF2938 domain-containing protein [Actinobacteria bacterium]|nr:DUF2938 domain-containing protein [Actinomycetota bacterium]